MSRAKKITGERMTHSFSQTPHFYLDTEVKLTELKEFKAKMTDATGFKFSYNDFIIAAVARSLKRYPLVNGSFVEGEIRVNEDINVALATATERGLLVPVIKEANKISLLELGKYRKKLVKKTREERITVEELEGGTFTISNLGMFGIKGFYPIINPPQAGILAVGKIEERVVAEKGKIGIEPMMDIRLAADHRVLDGVEGAKFLMSVKELLEDPDQLTG
ncbi:MAG: dihydrolipoamide acetyltransferase family protein [Halanaerobiaceae bacterium]